MAVRQALSDAKLSVHDVDGIAFTRGPGMAGCLAVCSNAAKTLAAAVNKPLVGVHHMVHPSSFVRTRKLTETTYIASPRTHSPAHDARG